MQHNLGVNPIIEQLNDIISKINIFLKADRPLPDFLKLQPLSDGQYRLVIEANSVVNINRLSEILTGHFEKHKGVHRNRIEAFSIPITFESVQKLQDVAWKLGVPGFQAPQSALPPQYPPQPQQVGFPPPVQPYAPPPVMPQQPWNFVSSSSPAIMFQQPVEPNFHFSAGGGDFPESTFFTEGDRESDEEMPNEISLDEELDNLRSACWPIGLAVHDAMDFLRERNLEENLTADAKYDESKGCYVVEFIFDPGFDSSTLPPEMNGILVKVANEYASSLEEREIYIGSAAVDFANFVPIPDYVLSHFSLNKFKFSVNPEYRNDKPIYDQVDAICAKLREIMRKNPEQMDEVRRVVDMTRDLLAGTSNYSAYQSLAQRLQIGRNRGMKILAGLMIGLGALIAAAGAVATATGIFAPVGTPALAGGGALMAAGSYLLYRSKHNSLPKLMDKLATEVADAGADARDTADVARLS